MLVSDARLPHVLIAGVATRGLAVSAARAGYRITAVDAFGDLDLRKLAMVIEPQVEPGAGRSALVVAAAARTVPAGLVAYTANFENHPEAVALLAHGRRLLGNSPEVLVRVRRPVELMRALHTRGFATPETRVTPARGVYRPGTWLLKPRRSGGGHGTTVWRPGRPVPKSSYLQRRIAGTPGSIVFAADGRQAVTLGLTRQLVGDARFGAHGFRYCGSLLSTPRVGLFPGQAELLETAAALAMAVTEEFGLVGLNGIDFIAQNGVPYPIEVNPRYSASMELVERANGVSMFRIHTQACGGILVDEPPPAPKVEGKAIVFARRDVTMGNTLSWVESRWVADVPHPGERIQRGRPICTVFARARDANACHRLLLRRAAMVYRQVERRRQGAA